MVELAWLIRAVPVPADVRAYAIAIAMATHPDQPVAPEPTRRYVRYGASPRALQAMILSAKVLAVLDRRYSVAREDIRAVAHAALRHRLILNFEARAERIDPDVVID